VFESRSHFCSFFFFGRRGLRISAHGQRIKLCSTHTRSYQMFVQFRIFLLSVLAIATGVFGFMSGSVGWRNKKAVLAHSGRFGRRFKHLHVGATNNHNSVLADSLAAHKNALTTVLTCPTCLREVPPTSHDTLVLVEVELLKKRCAKADKQISKLQSKLYERDRLDVLAELVHIYKERIVDYTLKFNKIGEIEYKWHHLVVYGEDTFESRAVKIVQMHHKSMCAELVTDVHFFMEDNPVPIVDHSTDSLTFVGSACEKARKFKFKKGDPHKTLASKLCDVIEFYYECDLIPTSAMLLTGPVNNPREWYA